MFSQCENLFGNWCSQKFWKDAWNTFCILAKKLHGYLISLSEYGNLDKYSILLGYIFGMEKLEYRDGWHAQLASRTLHLCVWGHGRDDYTKDQDAYGYDIKK